MSSESNSSMSSSSIKGRIVSITLANAETGKMVKVECSSLGSVDILRRRGLEAFNIEYNNQIMLYSKQGDEFYHPVDYKGTVEILANKLVFMFNFNRKVTDVNTLTPPTLMPLSPQEINIPLDLESDLPKRAPNKNIIISAMIEYERQFSMKLKQISLIHEGIEKRLSSVRESLEEQDVISQAIKATCSSLFFHSEEIQKAFRAFDEKVNKNAENYNKIIDSFPSDMEKLSLIDLHEALKTEERQTLADCVSKRDLIIWAEDNKKYHTTFTNKFKDLGLNIKALDNDVQDEKRKEGGIYSLSELKENEKSFGEQVRVAYENITKQINDVLGPLSVTINESTSDSTSTSSSTLMNSLHLAENSNIDFDKSLIPSLFSLDNKVKELQNKLSLSKQSMTSLLQQKMFAVSSLQSRIKELSQIMVALKAASLQLDRNFVDLDHVTHLPLAYAVALAEIVRRKKFGKLFLKKVNLMAETVASMREEENIRRDDFMTHHGKHLPRDLFDLSDRPPLAEVQMKAFDTGLPGIENATDDILKIYKIAGGGSKNIAREGGTRSNASSVILKKVELDENNGSSIEELMLKVKQLEEKNFILNNELLEERKAKEKQLEKTVSKVDFSLQKDDFALKKMVEDETIIKSVVNEKLNVLQERFASKDVSSISDAIATIYNSNKDSTLVLNSDAVTMLLGYYNSEHALHAKEVAELLPNAQRLFDSILSCKSTITEKLWSSESTPNKSLKDIKDLLYLSQLNVDDIEKHFKERNAGGAGGGEGDGSRERKISYSLLDSGCFALFCRLEGVTHPVYKAFHSNLPNRFLHKDCVPTVLEGKGKTPTCVVAEIILIEGPSISSGPMNYCLEAGEEYWEVFIKAPAEMVI